MAFPLVVLGGVLWPSSTSSNDTLTGQAGAGGASAAQTDLTDSNAPRPPPPAISSSGQATTPPGPDEPNGNSTVQDSQQGTQLTNNRVTVPASNAPANNGGSISIEAGTYSESEVFGRRNGLQMKVRIWSYANQLDRDRP